MKRKRFTEEQIAYALRQAEDGVAVAEVCRKLGTARGPQGQQEANPPFGAMRGHPSRFCYLCLLRYSLLLRNCRATSFSVQ